MFKRPKSASKKFDIKVLARDPRLLQFLLDLVNSQADTRQLVRQLPKKYPGMVPIYRVARPECFEEGHWLDDMRRLLQAAWSAPLGFERYAALADFQTVAWMNRRLRMAAGERLPDHTDCALEWSEWFAVYLSSVQLMKVVDRMTICDNPDCCTKYFIAGRKGQRFCSEKCSGEGDREAKRKWWREHGEEWREEWRKRRKEYYEKKRREKLNEDQKAKQHLPHRRSRERPAPAPEP